MSFPAGARYVDEPLVAAAAEEQVLVAQVLHEAAVHEDIHVLQQLLGSRVVQQFFVAEPCVAPDGLVRRGLDACGKFGKPFGLVCDNGLYVKPTDAGRRLLRAEDMRPPYDGAKPHFYIGDVDDRDYLSALVKATCAALPEPKPRKKGR